MNSRPIHFAFMEIGQREIAGDKHNQKILAYHSTVSDWFDKDEIPWCSSFVNYCFFMAGDETRTGSGLAQSWRHWGDETEIPVMGDLVVFVKPNTQYGHVGFYIDQTPTHVLVLGGNQSDSVSFQWYKKDSSKLKLHGFRTWP